MFGHSYFGAQYFGQRYFGPGTVVAVEYDCDLDATESPDTCEFVLSTRRGGGAARQAGT